MENNGDSGRLGLSGTISGDLCGDDTEAEVFAEEDAELSRRRKRRCKGFYLLVLMPSKEPSLVTVLGRHGMWLQVT